MLPPEDSRRAARGRRARTVPAVRLVLGGLLAALAAAGTAGTAAAAETVLVDGVPHVRNGAEPRDGAVTWQLQEQWRAGGEDDEVFFGVISDALVDDDGNLYLLDRQLCEVFVYSPAGALLRTLGGQGEGPGETRRPGSLLFMPDGSLGIVERFPGRIVKLDLEGNPAGTYTFGDAAAGGFGGIMGAACRGGQLVICGNRMGEGEGGGMLRTSYLSSSDPDGAELVRYLSSESEPDFSHPRYDEKAQDFVDRGRWALGPDGRVYTAPERDRLAVHVLAPDGTLERVIERAYQPRRRTAEDIADIEGGVVMIANGRRLEVEYDIEDCDPAVAALRVEDDGSLWVLTPQGARDLPDGIVRVFDVFDPDGTYARRVSIACGGKAEEDRLLFAGDRLLLIKGADAALDAMFAGFRGDGEDEEEPVEEPAPLEVVCYGRGS